MDGISTHAEVEHTAVANNVQYLAQQDLGHGVFFSTHHLKSGGSKRSNVSPLWGFY